MGEQVKFGFDVHGVIDKNPEFFGEFTKMLVAAGHEVHVITGARLRQVEPILKAAGVAYTHFFSIVENEEKKGLHPIDWDATGEHPYMDRNVWNIAKADYCKEQGIHLHIDDTPHYGDHFSTPFLTYRHEGVTQK